MIDYNIVALDGLFGKKIDTVGASADGSTVTLIAADGTIVKIQATNGSTLKVKTAQVIVKDGEFIIPGEINE